MRRELLKQRGTREAKELGRVPGRSGMETGEGRHGDSGTAAEPHRQLLHGSDQLFSAQVKLLFHRERCAP